MTDETMKEKVDGEVQEETAAAEPAAEKDTPKEADTEKTEQPVPEAEAEQREDSGENPDEDSAADSAESKTGTKDEGKKEKRRLFKRSKEEEKIEELEKEQAALNDRYLRVCAEYDNFRKRSQKEKDALYGDIKANTVSSFLPVYDNLERALKQGTEDEAYRKGVEMIMTQFNTTLEKMGVTAIDCLGEKFDPALHNAVMHVDDEEKGENEIVEVFQKGFKLGDKVIRFAMVKVAN